MPQARRDTRTNHPTHLPEYRAHKRTFIAHETLRLLVVTHGSLAFWVRRCFHAIGFISRKRRERKQGKSDIICAFVRHEIAMMRAAKFFNQRYPHLSVSLEFFDLERIDHIAKIASNQSILPFGPMLIRRHRLSRSHRQRCLYPPPPRFPFDARPVPTRPGRQ